MPSDPASPPLFDCQMCGDCCRGFGGTYVSDADLTAISDHTGIPVARLRQDYCQMAGSRPVLAQAPSGYCVFWDGLCTIHPVKPKMCRNWPFLPAVLIDPGNWRAMAEACPGMRADAPETAIRAEVRRAMVDRGEPPP